MKVFSLLVFLSTVVLSSIVNAVVPAGADSPAFYLVSSSPDDSANLLPVRTTGGTGGYATLTGTGPIGIYYFKQGKLTAAPSPGNTNEQRPFIGALLGPRDCTTYGSLGFVVGGSSNKCSRYDTFQIQSNSENSQLGARLSFNSVGAFYACGDGKDIWYKVASEDGPDNCVPADLYTIPVLQ